jgi:SOS-response transcriptional repressor LexA
MLMALNPSWPNRIIKIDSSATICGVVIGKWSDETQ